MRKSQGMPEPRIITPENPQALACVAVTRPILITRSRQIRFTLNNSSISSKREVKPFVNS